MKKILEHGKNRLESILFSRSSLRADSADDNRAWTSGTAFIERSNDSQWRELRNRRLALRQSRVSLEFVPRKGRGRRAKKSRERVSACLLPPSYETRVSHYPIAWAPRLFPLCFPYLPFKISFSISHCFLIERIEDQMSSTLDFFVVR